MSCWAGPGCGASGELRVGLRCVQWHWAVSPGPAALCRESTTLVHLCHQLHRTKRRAGGPGMRECCCGVLHWMSRERCG